MSVNRNSGKVTLFDRMRGNTQRTRGWTSQDVADLYRIGEQLTKFGFPVDVHTGESDDGDPWAVFERSSTEQVVVHIAKIEHELIIVDVVRDKIYRGKDFRTLADELLGSAPMVLPRAEKRDNVILHPRMVMMSFVAAAFVLADFGEVAVAQANASDPDGVGVVEDEAIHTDKLYSVTPKGDAEKALWRDHLSAASWTNVATLSGLAASLAALSTQLASNEEYQFENDPADGDTGFENSSLFLTKNYNQTDLIVLSENMSQEKVSNHKVATTKDEDIAYEHHEESDYLVLDVWVESKDEFLFDTSPGADDEDSISFNVAFLEVNDQSASDLILDFEAPISPSASNSASNINISQSEAIARAKNSILVLDSTFALRMHIDDPITGAIVLDKPQLLSGLEVDAELISDFSASSGSSEGFDEAKGHEQSVGSPNERYMLLSNFASDVEITDDAANVLVYAGGNVSVSGFAFGRDSIVVLEGVTPDNWLQSIDIVGNDIILMGQGGSITLHDALGTFV